MLAAALAGVLVLPADAARPRPPQPRSWLSDPVGDERALGAAFDIVSARLVPVGTTRQVGTRSVFTAEYLWASVTLSGPPSTTPGSTYTFRVRTTACGNGYFQWRYRVGTGRTGDLFVSGCGATSETVRTSFFVSGNALIWVLRLSDMGADLPRGTVFSQPEVYTDTFGTSAGNDEDLGLGIDTSIDSASAPDATVKL
jgi:hypothetical protein